MALEIVNAPIALKAQITDLCEETYRAHRDAAPQDWPGNYFELAIRPFIEQAFRSKTDLALKESPTLFAAMKDGAMVGYYRLSACPTDPKTEYYAVEIQDIYVLPECRGQGVAKAMINHAKALALDHDWDSLEATVADWHVLSRQVFEAEGFTVKNRRLSFGPDRPARDLPVLVNANRWHAVLWILIGAAVGLAVAIVMILLGRSGVF